MSLALVIASGALTVSLGAIFVDITMDYLRMLKTRAAWRIIEMMEKEKDLDDKILLFPAQPTNTKPNCPIHGIQKARDVQPVPDRQQESVHTGTTD